jgi:hypothetical protein
MLEFTLETSSQLLNKFKRFLFCCGWGEGEREGERRMDLFVASRIARNEENRNP